MTRLTRIGTRLAPAALLTAWAGLAAAQPDDVFWRDTLISGDWGTAGNWNPAVVPNNNGPNTFNALLRVAGSPYTVTLDLDVTIENFTLDSPSATLDLTTNALTINA